MLPFAGTIQTPADVFLERLDGPELAGALRLQLFWAVALLGVAQGLVALATRRRRRAGRLRRAPSPARSWRLYWRLVGASTRAQMQYKTSFVLATWARSPPTSSSSAPCSSSTGASRTWPAGRWRGGLAVGHVLRLLRRRRHVRHRLRPPPGHIRLGTFDRVLIRPLGAFFQTLASTLTLRRVGPHRPGRRRPRHRPGQLALDWTPDRLAMLGLALVSGAAIFFAIFVARRGLLLLDDRGTELMNTFTYGGTTLASYPLDIFDAGCAALVTFVLPLAFVNYYPALYILGRPDPLGLPAWTAWLRPVAAVVCAPAPAAPGRPGVRRYQSTGS